MTTTKKHWYDRFRTDVLMGVIVFIVIMAVFNPRDATDEPNGARSGMLLRIDHGTGCQYLANPRGGITPRLDTEGKHMCGGHR